MAILLNLDFEGARNECLGITTLLASDEKGISMFKFMMNKGSMTRIKAFIVVQSLCVASLILMCPQLAVAEQDGRIKVGLLDYARSDQTLQTWMQQNFHIKVGGDNSGQSKMIWVGYFNMQGIGSPKQALMLKDFTVKNNFVFEDILLHYKVDTTSKVNFATKGMDKFDVYEGKNGLLVSEDLKSFTDVTDRAYMGDTRLARYTFFGYEEAFAQINVQMGVTKDKSSPNWEYWNGSAWVKLAVDDGTKGLSESGAVNFTPPADWKRVSVNQSRSKYFVRLENKNGKNVVTKRIFGESWANENEKACKGWDPTSSTIVNKGELAFNPTPPSNARARFRYQSRIPFWAGQSGMANIGNEQELQGKLVRPWVLYATETIISSAKEKGYTGMLCDDVSAHTPEFIASTDWKQGQYKDDMKETYRQVVELVHAQNKDFLLGGNIPTADLAFVGDWNALEFIGSTSKTGMPRGITVKDGNTPRICYDDYLPENNPKRIFGYLVYDDTAPMVIGINLPWDRANRGPMSALSKHLIAMNENTIFGYFSKGGYIYDERDEVFLNNGTVLHMAKDPLPKLEDVKRWAQWFPAMRVNFGVPDTSGMKGGARMLDWKTDEQYKLPIWRRDFTNAIVIHKPAVPSTPREAYENPTFETDLGGTYYPLLADGSTAAPIQKLTLRAAEGAILMKHPLTKPVH